MKPVPYAGVLWEKCALEHPAMAEEPVNVPLCPYCAWKDVRSEARPRWEDVRSQDGSMRTCFKRDPVVLECSHPCHESRPFILEVADSVWDYASKIMRLDDGA